MHRCAAIAVGVGLVAIAGGGCARLDADFQLDVTPRTPIDQEPFGRGPSIKLVIEESVGTEVVPLGEPGAGTVDAEGLGPLEDAMIGLALELPTNDDPTVHLERLVAYGEVGPFTLDVDDEPVSADMLVAEIGKIGGLETLGAPRFGSAVALTGGDVTLYGGVGDLGDPVASDQVLVMHDLDGGDWRFEPAGLMPSVGGNAARYLATASPVDADGTAAVLVAGGRADPVDPLSAVTTALLWDPAAGLPLWSGDALAVARAGHAAVTLPNGRVLLVGGDRDPTTGDGLETSTFEVFDPAFLATSQGQQALPVPSTGFAIADLGSDGVLLCGGSAPIAGGATASAGCARVSVLANVQDAASLPTAVHFAAMAPVGDGKVLLCGGATGTISGSGTVPATSDAWLYDVATNTWEQTGSLHSPRALHAVLPLADGRAAVVGGADSAGLLEAVGDAVDCVEVYDPQTGQFTETHCTGIGAGAFVGVTGLGGDLAFVLSGHDGAGVGGATYGVVGLGPTQP